MQTAQENAEDPHLEQLRTLFLEQIPFNRVLGIEIRELARGRVLFGVPFRPELVGDPVRPALHGGVLSAVADTCGGCAVWSTITGEDRISTIDLRVDYLRPARLEELLCLGTVLRIGNRVGVAKIKLFHADAPDDLVAEAKGVYSVRRGR